MRILDQCPLCGISLPKRKHRREEWVTRLGRHLNSVHQFHHCPCGESDSSSHGHWVQHATTLGGAEEFVSHLLLYALRRD